MNQFPPKIPLFIVRGYKKDATGGWGSECIKPVHQLLPLYPALVIGDIFSVEQLIGWGVFAQAVL